MVQFPENTNNHIHTDLAQAIVKDYIANGGIIVGFDQDKNIAYLSFDDIPPDDKHTKIDGSSKNYACDIKAFSDGLPVYIEIVRVNKMSVVRKAPKIMEYEKFYSLVVLIDVNNCYKECSNDEETFKELVLKTISEIDKQQSVTIFDFRKNKPSLKKKKKKYRIKKYEDYPDYVSVLTVDNQKIAISKIKNGFVVSELKRKFGEENVIIAKNYDDALTLYENCENKNI